MNFSYQQQTLASANPIELVVALYDGAIRFLRQAIAAVEVNDVRGRRRSVKFALDIFLHLQSRLRYDVDARVAGNFSQFYIEMFRHTLLASSANSREGFETIIERVSQLRDAWKIAASNPEALRALERGQI
ncbi:MAG TPA: flagellar export chaperone FliS [Granulicella sp.]|jgi:flagellar protein FliS|nr:flagellar export chaperone FliS [Granulicella sp.]